MGNRFNTPRIENSVISQASLQMSLEVNGMRISYYQILPQQKNNEKCALEKKTNKSLINNDFRPAHFVYSETEFGRKP
jgi:hypothetical protein